MTPITTVVRNGVETATLFATPDAVDRAPEAAQFRFRAHNRWIPAMHSEATIQDYFSASDEGIDEAATVHDADHPTAPVGDDRAPTHVEYLVHALASSLTAGLVNIAADRGVELVEVTSTIEGDINFYGVLGLDAEMRNGFERVRVRFAVKGNASPDKLREIVEQAQARSAVFDVITNGVAVSVVVDPR